jgi:hypothetical protein
VRAIDAGGARSACEQSDTNTPNVPDGAGEVVALDDSHTAVPKSLTSKRQARCANRPTPTRHPQELTEYSWYKLRPTVATQLKHGADHLEVR